MRTPAFPRRLIGGWVGLLACAISVGAQEGAQVVVVFNSSVAASRDLAFYYAQRREVPTNQVLGFDLPATETMTRAEFRDRLQKPLLKTLEKQGWLTIRSIVKPATFQGPGDVTFKVTDARVRYLALCFGVPVRILKDPGLSEPGVEKLPEPLRRNEAAVDSELAVLPGYYLKLPLAGPITNPLYGCTNRSSLHPTNNLLMVARLDGPSVEIARGLVDKALAAEADGLWGRAYFDLRGVTTNGYKVGDDWLRQAVDVCRRSGFETVVDEGPGTFPAGFPMSQIAFYAGWYDTQVSGPFTLPQVEFRPGAFAYHLYSFSAHVLRSADQYWVGPLLAKGATATMGFVDEPYLEATPDLGVFFARFIMLGFSFGEAALAAQPALSWQTTVVGDPLYRPFGRKSADEPLGRRLQDLHGHLLSGGNKDIEWSHLQVANLNLAMGYPVGEVLNYLEQEPTTQQSAVLLEKLATLYYSQGKLAESIAINRKALKLEMSPQQRIRVMLSLASTLALYAEEPAAFDVYRQFLKEFPDYPDRLGVDRRALTLARGLNRSAEVDDLEADIKRLSSK
jgi:uncharacterized protein (TIGR03790 family)